MNFQGYQRNSMWNYQRLIKKSSEIFRGDQEKIMWNFQRSCFLIWNFQEDCNTILLNFRVKLAFSEISRVNYHNLEIPIAKPGNSLLMYSVVFVLARCVTSREDGQPPLPVFSKLKKSSLILKKMSWLDSFLG